MGSDTLKTVLKNVALKEITEEAVIQRSLDSTNTKQPLLLKK